MKTGEYRYTINTTEGSSSNYGLCEVCGKHATEVFHQREEQHYKFDHNGEKHEGWTQHECNSYFGHKECLESKRRSN
jgi:hypothetical protein